MLDTWGLSALSMGPELCQAAHKPLDTLKHASQQAGRLQILKRTWKGPRFSQGSFQVYSSHRMTPKL